MSDNEKYFTQLVDGDLAIRTLAQEGTIISEDKKDPKRYVTALVQTENGKQLCIKTVEVDGGSGGQNVKKPKVVEDLTSTSITLDKAKANYIYKYGTLTSLTVSDNDISDEETIIYFRSGNSITTSFPNTLNWVNENELSADPNTNYIISIVNNIAVWATY